MERFKLLLNADGKDKSIKNQSKRKIQVSNILLFPEKLFKPQNIHLGTIYVHCPNTQ